MPITKKFASVMDKIDALIDLQELYEVVLNTISQGVVVFDNNSKIIYVNQAICDLYGIKDPNKIVGKHLSTVFDDGELEIKPLSYGDHMRWLGLFRGTE